MPSYNAERDLRILAAMAEQVRTYLLEDALFWPISGSVRGGMPRLTIGGLLLRKNRLTALRHLLSAKQETRIDEAVAAFEEARDEWAMRYDARIVREWDMRMGLLQAFLGDCLDSESNKRDCGDYWPSQAEQRTMLHHLQDESESRKTFSDRQRTALAHIDRGLRQFLIFDEQNAFLWAGELADVYPRDPYWWLWVIPRSEFADVED